MRKLLVSLAGAGLIATPVQAREWQDQVTGVQPGVFVGAKLRMSLGGKEPARPTAALAIAPTQYRISADGRVDTRIGEGIALNFGAAPKPTLTLAGVRANRALGLQGQGKVDEDQKHGMSTTGWIAIGASAALVVGVALFLGGIDCAQADDPCES